MDNKNDILNVKNDILNVLNGLNEVIIDDVKYVIFNGVVSLNDYKIALEYAKIKGLSEVHIKDYEGLKTISVEDLTELISQMIIFGYETWVDCNT